MKKVLLIALNCLLLSASVAFAQGPPPPPPPPGPLGGGGGTAAPIDNEVVLLLLAASAFGAWKLRKKKAVSL